MNHVVYALVDGETVHYIGYTSRLAARQKTHKSKHPTWRPIVVGAYRSREEGLDREAWWIRRLRDAGYPLINISDGGTYGLPGLVKSSLTCARISAAKRREKLNAATLAKYRSNALGNKWGLGHVVTQEARAHLSALFTGRALSLETRAKLSAVRTGRRASPETRAKMSAAAKGHAVSAETRAKISAGHIKRKSGF